MAHSQSVPDISLLGFGAQAFLVNLTNNGGVLTICTPVENLPSVSQLVDHGLVGVDGNTVRLKKTLPDDVLIKLAAELPHAVIVRR